MNNSVKLSLNIYNWYYEIMATKQVPKPMQNAIAA